MKKTRITIGIVASIIAAIALTATIKKEADPITFTATAEEELKLYIENYSDTTLVIHHVTVITSGHAVMSPKEVRITNGALYIKAPIVWRAGEDATVMIGCTYGQVNFVRQVTKFL